LLALAAVVVVAVLALVVSGGGGSGVTLVSDSAIAQAAHATEKVRGATVSLDGTISVSGLQKPIGMHLEGVEDLHSKSGRVAGTYSDFPKQVPGASSDGTVPVELVMVPPDFYMKSPLLASALPDGKSWLHTDVAREGKKLGVGGPGQFGQADPTETLQNLRATSGRVEDLGHEKVRGTDTTHYRATVEIRKLVALAPPAQRAAAQAHTARLIQLIGTDSYPIEVWIDRHHLVRRTRFSMKMHIPGQSQTMTMEMTGDMYDFGPKPKTKRPPASDTVDAAKLTGTATP
jgi:hypothetical protein